MFKFSLGVTFIINVLFWKDVVLGFIEYEQSKRKQFSVVNLILLLVKFHIHRCKYSNSRSLFFCFYKNNLSNTFH